MAGFSFSTVRKIPLKATVARPNDLTEEVARIIDPVAWQHEPQPTIEALQILVAALKDDLDWLSATPTTPEGEYNLIAAEQRQQPMMLNRHRPVVDQEMTAQRRETAKRKARQIARLYWNRFFWVRQHFIRKRK